MSPLLEKLLSCGLKEMLAFASQADADELATEFAGLSDAEVERFNNWTLGAFANAQVRCVLTVGAVLHLYSMATERAQPEAFIALREKLGVSKTKAYDAIAIFRRFGKVLLENPNLHSQFPLESLKRLSSKAAPPSAGDEAIRLAARGERVTIKRADELLGSHQVDAEPDGPIPVAASPQTKAPTSVSEAANEELWAYQGDYVRVVILSRETKSLANTLIQNDVSAAFQHLQKACAEAVSHSESTDAA